MSIYSGPETAPTANLVFAYDTRNARSYAGPETVNLTTNPLPNGTAVGFFNTFSVGNNFAAYNATEQAIWWHRETYEPWGAYLQWDPVFTGTLDTSNNYTISFEWKTKNNANSVNALQFQIVQGNGVSAAMGSGILASLSTIRNDGWRVFKYTTTPLNSGVGSAYMRVIFVDSRYFAANSNTTDFFIRKIQFEKQPFQTPFVVGTRSNTQVLTDLTGRTQITANSLTYDANSFSFGGNTIGNYIEAANTPSLQFLNNSPYTLEAWVYPTADPGTTNYSGIINRESRIDGSKRDGYNLWLITDVSNTQNLVLATERFTSNVPNTAFGVYITVTASTILNNWSHIVASYDGARVKLYLNSNYLGQSSVDAGSISNEQKTLEIGRRGADSQCFTGRIDGVKIYNKALTDKEVKQNFIALKGRYGL